MKKLTKNLALLLISISVLTSNVFAQEQANAENKLFRSFTINYTDQGNTKVVFPDFLKIEKDVKIGGKTIGPAIVLAEPKSQFDEYHYYYPLFDIIINDSFDSKKLGRSPLLQLALINMNTGKRADAPIAMIEIKQSSEFSDRMNVGLRFYANDEYEEKYKREKQKDEQVEAGSYLIQTDTTRYMNYDFDENQVYPIQLYYEYENKDGTWSEKNVLSTYLKFVKRHSLGTGNETIKATESNLLPSHLTNSLSSNNQATLRFTGWTSLDNGHEIIYEIKNDLKPKEGTGVVDTSRYAVVFYNSGSMEPEIHFLKSKELNAGESVGGVFHTQLYSQNILDNQVKPILVKFKDELDQQTFKEGIPMLEIPEDWGDKTIDYRIDNGAQGQKWFMDNFNIKLN